VNDGEESVLDCVLLELVEQERRIDGREKQTTMIIDVLPKRWIVERTLHGLKITGYCGKTPRKTSSPGG